MDKLWIRDKKQNTDKNREQKNEWWWRWLKSESSMVKDGSKKWKTDDRFNMKGNWWKINDR